jgi:hypothetical protein
MAGAATFAGGGSTGRGRGSAAGVGPTSTTMGGGGGGSSGPQEAAPDARRRISGRAGRFIGATSVGDLGEGVLHRPGIPLTGTIDYLPQAEGKERS